LQGRVLSSLATRHRRQSRRRSGTGGKYIGEFRKRRERPPFGVLSSLARDWALSGHRNPPADVVRCDRLYGFLIAANDGVGRIILSPVCRFSSSLDAKVQAVSLRGGGTVCSFRSGEHAPQAVKHWFVRSKCSALRSAAAILIVFRTNNFPGQLASPRALHFPDPVKPRSPPNSANCCDG